MQGFTLLLVALVALTARGQFDAGSDFTYPSSFMEFPPEDPTFLLYSTSCFEYGCSRDGVCVRSFFPTGFYCDCPPPFFGPFCLFRQYYADTAHGQVSVFYGEATTSAPKVVFATVNNLGFAIQEANVVTTADPSNVVFSVPVSGMMLQAGTYALFDISQGQGFSGSAAGSGSYSIQLVVNGSISMYPLEIVYTGCLFLLLLLLLPSFFFVFFINSRSFVS